MKRFKELITELFDKPAKLRYIVNREIEWGTIWQAEFTVDKTDYIVYAKPSSPGSPDEYEVMFEMSGTGFIGKANVGAKTALVVFSTVMQFINDFVTEVSPELISFAAAKSKDDNPESRIKLYTSLVKKYLPRGYSFKTRRWDTHTLFELQRK